MAVICVGCGASWYSTDMNTRCVLCPLNHGSLAAVGAISGCACDAGWSGTNGNCTGCAPGKFKPGPGSEACTACSGGSHSHVSAISCTPCQTDSYSAGDRSRCQICPLNSGSAVGSDAVTDCSCNPGWSGINVNCVGCAPGTYKGGHGSEACAGCGAGEISDAEAYWCTACAAGSYAADDYSFCLSCLPNMDSVAGSTDVSGCFCNTGWSDMNGSSCTHYTPPPPCNTENVAQMCGPGMTAGTCAVTAVLGRGTEFLLDGYKTTPRSSNFFFGYYLDTTVVIDLKRDYRISRVHVWGEEYFDSVKNIVLSVSDTSYSQSSTSCSSGLQHVCGQPLTKQTYQWTPCGPDVYGRYFCMQRSAWSGMEVQEIEIYAEVCPPCYANQYRSRTLECMYCPAHSHLPANNIEAVCVCDVGFSKNSEGSCYFDACPVDKYRYMFSCVDCPQGSTSQGGLLGIEQCVCADSRDIAQYVTVNVTCSGECACTSLISDKHGVMISDSVHPDNECTWVVASNAIIFFQISLYELSNSDRYIQVNRCATASCDSELTHLQLFNYYEDRASWGEPGWTSTATHSILQTTSSQPFLQVVYHFGQWMNTERFSANWWTHSLLFGCITCPPGKHRTLDAFSGAEVCVWCDAGKYKTDTSTSVTCTNCLAGRMTLYTGSNNVLECICIGWREPTACAQAVWPANIEATLCPMRVLIALPANSRRLSTHRQTRVRIVVRAPTQLRTVPGACSVQPTTSRPALGPRGAGGPFSPWMWRSSVLSLGSQVPVTFSFVQNGQIIKTPNTNCWMV